MEPNQMVCSLGLARELKALGVPQDSLWWWEDFCDGEYQTLRQKPACENKNKYSAFTVAELGELLPVFIFSMRRQEDYICKSYLQYDPIFSKVPMMEADTEANARAKTLIYLLKNKLLNLDNNVDKVQGGC